MWVGITTLLALSVYQIIVNNTLPTTSDAIPLLGQSLTVHGLGIFVHVKAHNTLNDSTASCVRKVGGVESTCNFQSVQLQIFRIIRKQQKLQKVILFSSTLTHSQCDVGNITFCNFCCFRCASP